MRWRRAASSFLLTGSKSQDYCEYCYVDGAFTSDSSMEEMIEFCVPHMVKANAGMSEEQARMIMGKFFPSLKRWAKA